MLHVCWGLTDAFENLFDPKRKNAGQPKLECEQLESTVLQFAEQFSARFKGCFGEIDFAVAIIRNIRINNSISVTARVTTVHFLPPLSL
jgi:hypothetical protein